MDLELAASRVAGLKTRDLVTEVENLAKNLGAALDDLEGQTLDVVKSTVKPKMEKIHRELSGLLDSISQIPK